MQIDQKAEWWKSKFASKIAFLWVKSTLTTTLSPFYETKFLYLITKWNDFLSKSGLVNPDVLLFVVEMILTSSRKCSKISLVNMHYGFVQHTIWSIRGWPKISYLQTGLMALQRVKIARGVGGHCHQFYLDGFVTSILFSHLFTLFAADLL